MYNLFKGFPNKILLSIMHVIRANPIMIEHFDPQWFYKDITGPVQSFGPWNVHIENYVKDLYRHGCYNWLTSIFFLLIKKNRPLKKTKKKVFIFDMSRRHRCRSMSSKISVLLSWSWLDSYTHFGVLNGFSSGKKIFYK